MGRTSYNIGPGWVEVGPSGAGNRKYIYAKGDISVVEALETEIITASAFGPVDEILMERAFEVSFEPLGEVEFASIYMPYLAKGIGDDLFPQTDEPLIIYGADLTKRTYSAAAMLDMPQLNLGTGKTLWGPLKYMCLGTGDAAWSAANNLVQHQTGQAIGTQLLPAHTLATAAIKRNVYTAAWGTKIAPFNAIKTIDGFTINVKLNLGDKKTDQYGLVNKYIQGYSVDVTFSPIGITEADMTTIQTGADPRVPFFFQGTGGVLGGQMQGGAAPYNAGRGMSIGASGADLVITGGTSPYAISATIKNAIIKKVEYDWSPTNPRVKSITMNATVGTYTSKVADLFAFTIV